MNDATTPRAREPRLGGIDRARKRVFKWARRRLDARARRRVQALPALRERIESYLAGTESTGCSWIDYDVLHRHVRAHRPAEVLECGTGVSTVVIAQALSENAREGHPGRVTSMEESEHWFAMAGGLLPDDLREHVDLRLSDTVEDAWSLFRGVRYRDVPERDYAFAFIDGPNPRAPSDGHLTFDFDLLHLLRRADWPVRAVVDSRLSTAYVLQRVLGPERCRFDPYRNLSFVGPCSRADLGGLGEAAGPTLAHSRRLLRPTVFDLRLQPLALDPAARFEREPASAPPDA